MATDGSNVYVTGSSKITPWDMEFVTIAYSGAGARLWTNRFQTDAHDLPATIAVDRRGHVYVAGTCTIGEGFPGYLAIAYLDTGARLWLRTEPTGFAQAIAVDGGGNLYVTGQAVSGFDTVCYSGATRVWENRYSSFPNTAYARAVAVGSSSNVYVTGYASSSADGYDYATLAYSNDGTPLWTNRFNGPANTNDYAQALAVGSSGNVYVTGYSSGTNGSYEYLTLAYSSNGVPLWTNRFNEPGGSQAYALAVDRNDTIYVTGQSGGDCVTIKYAAAPDILFSGIELLPGGDCRLTITAPTNLTFRLEASSNLASWLTLTNYTNLPTTSIQYTDAPAPGFPARFYRAAWSP